MRMARPFIGIRLGNPRGPLNAVFFPRARSVRALAINVEEIDHKGKSVTKNRNSRKKYIE